MNEHPATLLRCVVERITYQNPENGYSVLKVKVKGYSDLVTLVGNPVSYTHLTLPTIRLV